MKNTDPHKLNFKGFSTPKFTQVPDELFDELMTELSGAELKVLLYIIRRTYGFKKDEDNISLSQLLNGIKVKNGDVLDKGTGVSKKTLLAALSSLQEQNIIFAERRRSAERGNEPTTYRLNVVSYTPVIKANYPPSEETTPTLGVKTPPSPSSKNSPTQETVLQETVIQHRNSSKKQNNRSEHTNPQHSTQSIGDLLKQKTKLNKEPSLETPASIKVIVQDISQEFGDHQHTHANITQVMRLVRESGKNPESFHNYLYEAESITKQQGQVRKKMPYFFEVLKDRVGLKSSIMTRVKA